MKFKILLEYCGTNYSGWQLQKNSKTIQGTLIDTVRKIFSESKGYSQYIDLQGSGRTDKGVHAYGQVAHLECETMLAPEILKLKLNDLLPSDINILEIEKTKNNFHARHSATSREYLYRISTRRTALEKKFVWWIKDKLDYQEMKKVSNIFLGMHDFYSFCDLEKSDASTKVMVEELELTEIDHIIFFRIRASHFLWKMVRRLTGCLIETGRKNISFDELKYHLENHTSELSKFTAPPSGLFLNKIYY